MSLEKAVTAANHFGLGARPGELTSIESDPEGWLEGQVTRRVATLGSLAHLPSSDRRLARLLALRDGRSERRRTRGRRRRNRGREEEKELTPEERQEKFRELTREAYLEEAGARTRAAIQSIQPFQERLVHFWSNHFTVSITNPRVAAIAGAYEREAIRPHVMGKFADMLLAATRHPAMLMYLNNEISVGPNSKAGRRRDRGLNENLAREILELHTLGVNGGYTQEDVTAFARILTGWTVANGDFFPGTPGTFTFVEDIHEPGAHRVLGKTYPEDGMGQGVAVLYDLARHPATADFVSEKLARHFFGDAPPAESIERLSAVFRASDGDLALMARELIRLPYGWRAEARKLKSPNDYVISTMRAIGLSDPEDKVLAGSLDLLGQRPFYAPSPAGWPDTAEEWAGADAVLKRVEWAGAVSGRVGNFRNPVSTADSVLGPSLSDETMTEIRRAESRRQGLALLLASPDFQWR